VSTANENILKQTISFVSTFPTEANMRDGYFRRVHYVDQAFTDEERIHLDIRFAKNFVRKTIKRDEHTKIMHLNVLLHFMLIYRVLRKSGIIYIHSIAKVPSILLQLILLRNLVPFALDVHGVMVNELKLENKILKAWFYNKIEKYCFNNSRLNIYVSNTMKQHFRQKYPNYPGNEVIFATNSNPQPTTHKPPLDSLTLRPSDSARQQLLQDLNIQDTDVVMLYSGNMQAWQNIDLMLDIMESLVEPQIKFLILSGQKGRFEEKLRVRKIPCERINVLSVSPDNLAAYYELAHYGFILRDDILINRVANPTKLAEYLQYGITPIVKLAEIGDYKEMGYEYVRAENFQPLRQKSDTNLKVHSSMTQQYGNATLRTAISETIGNTN